MAQTIKPTFRPDIEGLRGVAILLVVLYHVRLPPFLGGFVGVDIFFVLSGYLITGLLVREIESTGKLDLLTFYARRARRLLPALALTLFATMIVGFLVYSPLEQRFIAPTAYTTAAYVSNLHFAWFATDYLAMPAGANPLLHTWSLSVEEQFYFAWPILVLFAFRAKRDTDASKVRRGRILLFMSVVALVSFAACLWLTYTKQPWAFFSSPTRAWEFAIGGLGVLVGRTSWKQVTQALGWIGLAALLSAAVLFDERTSFPGFAALLPALGTVAVLCAGASGPDGGLVRYLSARPLQRIGKLSYSWYLWHWPVLTFAAVIGGDISLWTRLLCLAFSLGLAAVTFRLIEDPLHHNKILAAKPIYALAMAACLYFFGVGASVLWRQVSNRAAQSPEQLRFTRANSDFLIFDQPTCHVNMQESQAKGCTFESANASKTVVLFGDSHAAQWYPPLRAIAETENWRLVTLTKSFCPATDVEFVNPSFGRRFTECESWRADALKLIRDLHPDLVVVTNTNAYATGEKPIVNLADWTIGTQRTLRAISQSAKRVVFLRDTPIPGIDIPACLARVSWRSKWSSGGTCSVSKDKAVQEDVKRVEQQASTAFANVEYVDMTDYICPGDVCEPERGDLILYRDSNHLTGSFMKSLTPVIRKLLNAR
jgi:peptidoglycan/LPS O-acetylase OafA/YrhL